MILSKAMTKHKKSKFKKIHGPAQGLKRCPGLKFQCPCSIKTFFRVYLKHDMKKKVLNSTCKDIPKAGFQDNFDNLDLFHFRW